VARKSMSVFNYKARNRQGVVIAGQLAAASEAEVKKTLDEKGLLLIEARKGSSGTIWSFRSGRVSPAALLSFVRELKTLLGAGLPIAQVLEMLSERPKQPTLSAAVQAMHQAVLKGQSLGDAAATQSRIFDPLFAVTLRVGAQTGRLEQALDRYLNFLVLRYELRRNLQKALTYPIFLIGLLVVVLAGLFLFVLPRFADLYAEFGGELPFATRVLMAAVNAAPIAIVVAVPVFLALGFLYRKWAQTPAGRAYVDRFKLSLPVIGPVLNNMSQIQMCYLLSTLLAAGGVVRDALGFASESATNVVYAAGLSRAQAAVSTGKAVSDAFLEEKLLPETSISLVKAGEASGSLGAMFEEISKLHEQVLDDRMARVLALIEPAMMLLVGIVLGTVIIVVYLPIFGVADVIQ